MKIKSVTVGGFRNLEKTQLLLGNITAVISPNNYGKSNLLEAIDFGIEFLCANAKSRTVMMRWVRGIPINKILANTPFSFELEFEDDNLGEYRFVRYGYTFSWYKDDGTGQAIIDEWLDARPTESVRYTSYLKRSENKYRPSKKSASFRKILLDKSQLSIDVLSAIEDIELHSIIAAIKNVHYHICSSLDLGERFQAAPVEYIDYDADGSIAFDDHDVPRAIYQLSQQAPEKYGLFLEAIYTLFPEFTNISVQPYELKTKPDFNLVIASPEGTQISPLPTDTETAGAEIPFRIRDEMYRLLITDKNLNQPINMALMSTGTKRIFWLLSNVFIASTKGMAFIGVEELETSIHPKLLKRLLDTLDEILEDTSLIISSHSPFLVQYIKPEKIYVGTPMSDGIACFKKILPSRIKNLISAARDIGMSVGEYLFALMAGDSDSVSTLSFYLGGNSNG